MRRGLLFSAYDLIFPKVGTIGKVGILSQCEGYEKYTLSTNTMRLKVDPQKADPLYVYYYFTWNKTVNYIHALNSNSVQPVFNFSSLKKFPIDLPSIKYQQRVAHILGTLDDKIHLNRQINTTLESMAQTLFQSWFVHFDPVIDNALAEGNPIPEPLHGRAEARKALGEGRKPLPEAVRGAFPSRFVFSEEMGWIPEGWGVKPLVEITTELRRGISPKYIEEEGVRVVNQKCIRDHLINFSLTRRNDEKKKKIDGRELTIGDVLVNSTGVGTLGRMAQVYYLDETTVVDSHVTVVRADQEVVLPYIFGRMMLNIEPRIEAMGEGSTGQTELSRVNLQAFSVLVPSKECQIWVEEFFKGNAQKIVKNIREIETLKTFRDTLLPKLLSGDLDISAFL